MSNLRKYGSFLISTVQEFHVYNGDLRVTSELDKNRLYQSGLTHADDFLEHYAAEYRKIGADASKLHIRVRDKVSALYLNDWHDIESEPEDLSKIHLDPNLIAKAFRDQTNQKENS